MARITRICVTSLLVCALLAPAPVAIACGPSFPEVIFVESKRPDFPLERYAAGELGIVQPTYTPSYLTVAYRYLSGGTFDTTEQKQLVALWNHYLYPQPDLHAGVTNSRIRYALLSPSRYDSYPNCLEDAFLTSARTLQQRSQQFGGSSMAVVGWRDAQDKVFQNCESANGAHPILPPPADPGLPEIVRKDRDYQTAAAYFYSGALEEAKRRFSAISEDSSSPWRATAALVAARCDIREATLGDSTTEQERLAAADGELRTIIANPALSSVKASAERLRGFVQFRLNPDARFAELSNAIERRASPETLQQNLDDYTQIWRKERSKVELQSLRNQSSMTDWIYSFQGSGDTEEFRVSRWQQTKSPAWLVASLTYAQVDTPQLQDLLDAAAKVPATSPAYLTLTFHRDRLLAAEGKTVQAREDLDKILKPPGDRMPLSTRNLFTALRMRVARNLDEFLEFGPRRLVTVTDDTTAGDLPNSYFCEGGRANRCNDPLFDADAARELTEAIPTRLLAQAAQSSRLRANLRREIAQAAWTRAILLNDDPAARELAQMLSSLAPDLAAELMAYSGAPTLEARRFAAVFLISHRPELHPYIYAGLGRETASGTIDNYRDNWWCDFTAADEVQFHTFNFYEMGTKIGGALSTIYPNGKTIAPQFMSATEQRVADKEWNVLSGLPSAPSWLGQQVLDWSKAHPDDPRVPEALHLTVRATRFGCWDADSGDYSKQAFMLLHRRYPKSEWTTQTPYWY
jgi:hypothetical protein